MPDRKTQPATRTADRPARQTPEAPTLDQAEVSHAIHSGGIPGLIEAIRNKVGGPVLHHADVASIADSLIDQFRGGDGGPDHSEIVARLDQCIVAVDVLRKALIAAGDWVQANPGTTVIDGGHSTGRRRVFARPAGESL